jgi:hypothetical protein
MQGMKAYGGMDVWLNTFLISARGGGQLIVSLSGCFITGKKIPNTH